MIPITTQEELEELKKNNPNLVLWAGGAGEFVSTPTPLTFDLILQPFNHDYLWKKTATILKMPFEHSSEPYFYSIKNHSYVNITSEYRTFYGPRLSGITVSDEYSKPQPLLKINIKNIFNTTVHALKSTVWQANLLQPIFIQKLLSDIQDNLELIVSEGKTKSNHDDIQPLLFEGLAYITALGIIDGFFEQYVIQVIKPNYITKWNGIESLLQEKIRNKDEYFQSMNQLGDVHERKITLRTYLERFGQRAFDDYELSAPRFSEIQSELNEIIRTYSSLSPLSNHGLHTAIDKQDQHILNTYVEIRALRGSMKLLFLQLIAHTRSLLITFAKFNKIPSDLIFFFHSDELQHLQKHLKNAEKRRYEYEKNILTYLPPVIAGEHYVFEKVVSSMNQKSIQATPISQGNVTGFLKKISKEQAYSNVDLQHHIIILPDASPHFTHLYPQSAGILFLQGGVTSHGAIIAREYHKPAVSLGGNILELSEQTLVNLNGTTGEITLI
ncbi:MAG: PEP-utilizing enzyme [Candidatus Roizmanbacteria bacterium]